MTLSSLLADCYRRFGFQTSPDATVTTRFTAFLNETQREIVMLPGMARLLDGTITFTSVANQPEYGLPPSVVQVKSLRDVANRRRLIQESADWYRTIQPDPSTALGTPTHYALLGIHPVASRPSNASELFLKSTSGSDVQVAFYEIILATGAVRTGGVTLTGTTAVSLSGLFTDIIQVTDLYLASVAVGTITLLEDSGLGTELGRINVGQLRSRVQQIGLVRTPSSALTYTVDYEREVTELVQATDEPILPERFHALLSTGCRRKEYELRGDLERRQLADAEWEHGIGQLRSFLNSPPDRTVIPGGRRSQWSSLGPWFPADTSGPW